MQIRAIGFDYAGVISGRPGSEFNNDISKILQVSVQEFKTSFFKFNKLVNTAQISRKDFWQKVLAELNRQNKYEDVIAFVNGQSMHSINANMIALADRLRELGYKVGLLTNNAAEVREKFEEIGIVKHFDAIVISAEIGYCKPDRKAFEIFFEQLGAEPHEAVFIDVTEQSLINASEIGFYPILFTSYKTLVDHLKSIGVTTWIRVPE